MVFSCSSILLFLALLQNTVSALRLALKHDGRYLVWDSEDQVLWLKASECVILKSLDFPGPTSSSTHDRI